MSISPVVPLLLEKRVLVVAGAGGVGKTTVAAALALAAAAHGRRVLCLTIDPAKRLFDRLGLDSTSGAEQLVAAPAFGRAGLPVTGALTLVMLDPKRTFDDLVRRHASDPQVVARILGNEFYQYVSTQLAGTQAYMAMEKVLSVLSDDRYDLVVLDTPPTSDALDFLDAPERLIEVLDSSALGWLTQAFPKPGRFSLNLVARGVALVLRGIARLTGRGFLQRLAEFVTELNQLFGGFKERAHRVAQAFRGPEFAYALVATPEAPPLTEAGSFAERLERLGMRVDALIINRVLRVARVEPDVQELRRFLAPRGVSSRRDLADRVLAAYQDELEQSELQQDTIQHFMSRRSSLRRDRWGLRVEVPSFPDNVRDVDALVTVARHFL